MSIFKKIGCYTLLTIAITLAAFGYSVSQNSQSHTTGSLHIDKKYSYKIIKGAENTFGYDIYVAGRLMVHQNSIPAIAGNKGFKTKAQAERVAKLVIKKLEAGEMPPTVTIEELKKFKAI